MEETYNVMPKEVKGIFLKREDTFEIIAPSYRHRNKVQVSEKITVTDERAVTFKNHNDSPVVIKIRRILNEQTTP